MSDKIYHSLLTDTRILTDDKRLKRLITLDRIAQRYTWTFDYIESLPPSTIKQIKALLEGEGRYNKLIRVKTKNKGRRGKR